MPDISHYPVAVIRHDLDNQRHAIRGIPFIIDLFNLAAFPIFAGAALDRPLDIVLRHIIRTSFIHRQAEAEI